MVAHVSTMPGVKFDRVDTVAAFPVGTRARSISGGEFQYVQYKSAANEFELVVIEPDLEARAMTTSLALRGARVGVAMAVYAADEYGWAQIEGIQSVRALASCAANAAVNSVATAGAIDDDASTGTKAINGLALTTAAGSSANYPTASATYIIATALLVHPSVGATNA